MKKGVLGGTFDPVHIGHLIIAEEARIRLGLQQVLFVPAGEPWMKGGWDLTPAGHRIEMARLATASNPFFSVSEVEVRRKGPSYSVDTMTELTAAEPGTEFYFIMGIDSLKAFHQWKEPERLARLCRLAVLKRPGYSTERVVKDLEGRLPGITERIVFVEAPVIGISATEIRRRAGEGESIKYWAPEGVEGYIEKRGLYK